VSPKNYQSAGFAPEGLSGVVRGHDWQPFLVGFAKKEFQIRDATGGNISDNADQRWLKAKVAFRHEGLAGWTLHNRFVGGRD
jgi:hypothetical protein